MNSFQHLFHLFLYLRFRKLPYFQRISHIPEHIQVRPYRVGLKHHSKLPFFGRNKDVRGAYHFSVYTDFAGGGFIKSRYHAQHCSLTAAGRSQQSYELAFPEFICEVIQDGSVTVFLCYMIECNYRHFTSPIISRTCPL